VSPREIPTSCQRLANPLVMTPALPIELDLVSAALGVDPPDVWIRVAQQVTGLDCDEAERAEGDVEQRLQVDRPEQRVGLRAGRRVVAQGDRDLLLSRDAVLGVEVDDQAVAVRLGE